MKSDNKRSMINDYILKNRNEIGLGQAIIFTNDIYQKKGLEDAIDFLTTKLPLIAKQLESGIFKISSCPTHTHSLVHEIASYLQNKKLKSTSTASSSNVVTEPKRL